MAPTSVPIEVIELIIDETGQENDLRAFALTSRAFLNTVRRNLFRQVDVDTGRRGVLFATLLKDCPHITSYVHSLYIANQNPGASPWGSTFGQADSLAYIITTVSQGLKELTLLDVLDFPPFDGIPQSLRVALLEIFHSPSLKSLFLWGFTPAPMSHVAASQIERLDISHFASLDLNNSCVPLPDTHLPAICNLRRLTVSCASCACSISRVFPLCALKELEITDMPFEYCLRILSAARESLTRLTVGNLTNVSGGSLVDIRKLTHLSVSAATVILDPIGNLTTIALLLESGDTSNPHALESIVISLDRLRDRAMTSTIISHPLWTRLHAILLQQRYARLRDFVLRVAENCVDYDEVMSDSIPDFRPFWQQVPSLWKGGKLTVLWGKSIIVPNSTWMSIST